jgi:hypothetical protein
MMIKLFVTFEAVVLFLISLGVSHAEISKEKVYLAERTKNNAYIKEGMFTGGDRSTDQIEIQNIRRSSNKKFERIVIDLKKGDGKKSTELSHPPYYQAAMHYEKARFDVTLFGSPRLTFNPKKVVSAFKKSSVITGIKLLPKLEDDSWTFYLELKPGSLVEVFELSQPARIIIDIKKNEGVKKN